MLSSDHEIYKKATVDEKRLLLSQLFTNLVQNRYEIKPNYTSAAEYLANWVPKLNRDYELQKSITTKRKTGDFTPASPSWLRGLDDVRTCIMSRLAGLEFPLQNPPSMSGNIAA